MITESDQPHISVIIPAYNQARYLAFAVQSVLQQNFRDFEVIVVDDGSTDDTPAVAKEFGDAIRYFRQENRGLSAARNAGISYARADIIGLLDSDDSWEPEFLEEMLPLLENHPEAAASYCGFRYMDSDGRPVGKPSLRVVPPESFHRTLICQGNWLVPCAVVFRKHLAEKIGFFDESLHAVEDADLWIKLSSRNSFVGLPKDLVRYRRHDSNMTKNPKRMIDASLLQINKYFGSADDEISTWTPLKRCAYVRHYCVGIFRYLAAGDLDKSAWFFEQLNDLSPDRGSSIWLWHHIARIHIPEEYQIEPSDSFNWGLAQRDVTAFLQAIRGRMPGSVNLSNRYHMIEGGAFLALAEDAGRSDGIAQALVWLWRAGLLCPQFLISRRYWGILYRSLKSIRS